jgi:AcrR family transcriptional regulator
MPLPKASRSIESDPHPWVGAIAPLHLQEEGTGQGNAGRLLRAAVELFAERGFNGTSTREICTRAGTGEAAVYDHFASKEEMLYLTCRFAHEELLRRLEAAHSGESAADQLRSLVRELTCFHAQWAIAARVANYELAALTPLHRKEIEKLRKSTENSIERVIVRGEGEGLFGVQDVHATTFAILSMAIGVSRWFHSGGRLSPEELGEIYGDLVIAMLSGETKSPNAGLSR